MTRVRTAIVTAYGGGRWLVIANDGGKDRGRNRCKWVEVAGSSRPELTRGDELLADGRLAYVREPGYWGWRMQATAVTGTARAV